MNAFLWRAVSCVDPPYQKMLLWIPWDLRQVLSFSGAKPRAYALVPFVQVLTKHMRLARCSMSLWIVTRWRTSNN
jgi:hypothetical protein